jgi:hypothetical protein
MDPRLALELHLLKTQDPDKADALLQHLRMLREGARDRLEAADTDADRLRLQGEAQALRDLLGMFDEARTIVESAKRKNNSGGGRGPVLV